jgi:hypothetical protein
LEPRLRCTEMDENGNFTAVDGEFKKTELIAKVSEPAGAVFRVVVVVVLFLVLVSF